MSIVSVDNIQPIGSGTTVTVNKSVTLESGNTNITGVCTATSFVGSGANLTNLPAQVSISNNSDNRVITGGSGVNLNGESGVTYDGTNFTISSGVLKLTDESNGQQLRIGAAGDFYIEHDGNNTYLKNTTGDTVIQNDANVKITASSGGVERFKVDSSGNATISNGNLIVASGHGIDFSSTGDASGMTSELLDDYEEGYFQPTLDAPNQSGTGFTIFHNHGYYTKIGNIVTVTVYIQGYASSNASGGSNDDIKIIGLPFAPAVLPGSGSSNRHAANWTFGTTYKVEADRLEGYTYGGNSYIDLLVPSNGGTGTMLKSNQIDQNTCQFWCTATYRV